jgi:hypothetical protein
MAKKQVLKIERERERKILIHGWDESEPLHDAVMYESMFIHCG